jgi:hypothetical protein
LRRKSNGRGSEVESQKLKVECPDKSEELKRPQDSGINSNPGHRAGGEKKEWPTLSETEREGHPRGFCELNAQAAGGRVNQE